MIDAQMTHLHLDVKSVTCLTKAVSPIDDRRQPPHNLRVVENGGALGGGNAR